MRVKFKPWNWGFEEVSGTSLRGFVKKCTSDCGRAGCRITRLNIFFSCCFIPDFVLQIFYLSNDDYFDDHFIFIKKLTKITVWQKPSRDVPSNNFFSFSPTFLLGEAFHPKYGVVCFFHRFCWQYVLQNRQNLRNRKQKTSETECGEGSGSAACQSATIWGTTRGNKVSFRHLYICQSLFCIWIKIL